MYMYMYICIYIIDSCTQLSAKKAKIAENNRKQYVAVTCTQKNT